MRLSRSWPVLVVLAGLTPWLGTPAYAAATDWVGDSHAAVRFITASDIGSNAATLQAGLEFRFAPGWHGYWRTPGDAGLPPALDWSGSNDIVRVDVAWPAPSRLVVEGLQNIVYTDDLVLPTALQLKHPGKSADVKVSVGFAACAKVCVPYSADLALVAPAGAGTGSAEAPLIEAALAKVPRTPDAAGIVVERASILTAGQKPELVVELRSSAGAFVKPDLFVEGAGDGIPAAPDVDLRDGGQTARLRVSLPRRPSTQPLTLTLTDAGRAAEFTVQPPSIAPASAPTWAAILVSALLGGAILNLMPCVLPVLSIKLLALTRHGGESRRAVRLGFLATAFGNVACFGLLAAVLVGLKWSGASLGWGIQFQQPLFLAAMATVTVLFAASFFEWLPIRLPSALQQLEGSRSRGPLVEAFLTGVLATLLATPCSAPFVGTAVGFALSQGPAEIVAVFLCLGVGMALPYWTVALFPALVRWLPRPGAWMLVLRKGLGLVMLGTTLWLLFVLWSTAGLPVAFASGLALAGLLSYRAWLHLWAAQPGRPSQATAVTVALALASVGVALLPASASSPPSRDPAWQAFDPDALPGLVAAGKTVLVDVTATWCLTCKVNDVAALERSEVKGLIDRTGVIRMRADWSRPDPRIAAYLHGFSRYGIPLDVIYGPSSPQGEALPELLTANLVIEAINRQSAAATVSTASTP